jgi:phosphatidate cytidylyltransferase
LAPLALLTAYFGDGRSHCSGARLRLQCFGNGWSLLRQGASTFVFSCAGAVAGGWPPGLARSSNLGFADVGLGALARRIFCTIRAKTLGDVRDRLCGALLLAPILLRARHAYGFAVIALLFAIVWTTDVCGYFAGRALGGPKLMPAVSPKKPGQVQLPARRRHDRWLLCRKPVRLIQYGCNSGDQHSYFRSWRNLAICSNPG